MRVLIILIMGLVCLSPSLLAQNETDALRYSFLDIYGSGRSLGMGGAFGGLGADLSSLSSNPAGIGLYRRSDFGMSLGIGALTSATVYENTQANQTDVSAGLTSIGYVGSYPTKNTSWKRINFGIGYNRLVNFDQDFTVRGEVQGTSLLDIFLGQVTQSGISEEEIYDAFPFGAALAWDTYLLDTAGGSFFHQLEGDQITQIRDVERSGSYGETVLSAGANYENKFYFGVSLAFPRVRFYEESRHREGELEETHVLEDYVFVEDLSITGSGFNAKLGFIYRVSNWLRIGGALHTPTWIGLTDTYSNSVTATFRGNDPLSSDSPIGSYRYRVTTPSRYQGNAAFILGKYGVVSADYEFVDYSTARLGQSNSISDDYDFAAENDNIQTIYRGTHNVRAGVELRLVPKVRLRAGAGYQQSPFVNSATTSNGSIITFTGGGGVRFESFYADLAYVHRSMQEDFYMYDPALVESATVDKTTGMVVLSGGFRF